MIETHPASITEERGKTVELVCVSRNANVTYAWYKNKRYMRDKHDRKLELQNISHEDEAEYCCVVGNDAGKVTSNIATLTLGEFMAAHMYDVLDYLLSCS